MDRTKTVWGAMLLHVPVLGMMACIHWSWTIALAAALVIGIVGGLLASTMSAEPVASLFSDHDNSATGRFGLDSENQMSTGPSEVEAEVEDLVEV